MFRRRAPPSSSSSSGGGGGTTAYNEVTVGDQKWALWHHAYQNSTSVEMVGLYDLWTQPGMYSMKSLSECFTAKGMNAEIMFQLDTVDHDANNTSVYQPQDKRTSRIFFTGIDLSQAFNNDHVGDIGEAIGDGFQYKYAHANSYAPYPHGVPKRSGRHQMWAFLRTGNHLNPEGALIAHAFIFGFGRAGGRNFLDTNLWRVTVWVRVDNAA